MKLLHRYLLALIECKNKKLNERLQVIKRAI